MHDRTATVFSDLALSRRLERAEGFACAQFAKAQARLFPDRGAEVLESAGAFGAFNGVDSPITQSFGLGLIKPLNGEVLDLFEHFFQRHGAAVDHEISPFVGVDALGLLCSRGYEPLEISNVLYTPLAARDGSADPAVRVRVVGENEADLWTRISAEGWAHDNPALLDFLTDFGTLLFARPGSVCFLAEWNGEPGAAGALSLHEGVALMSGASTIPALRRRGLQSALLEARLAYAEKQGCDLAMMVAAPGSDSQRNAQRQNFRIAYTRTKWRLSGR